MLTDMQKTAALAKEAKRLGLSYGKPASGLGFTAKEKLFRDYERELGNQGKREKEKERYWAMVQRQEPPKAKKCNW